MFDVSTEQGIETMDAKTEYDALTALIRAIESRDDDTDYERLAELNRLRDIADDKRLREHYEHVHAMRIENDTYDLY